MVAVARILRGGEPIGGAFVTSFDQVFTASHVINEVLGLEPLNARSPVGDGRPISLDFPFADNASNTARMARWTKPSKEDISTLILEDGLPSDINPCLIVPDPSLSIGQRVRIYGFPSGYDEGVWSYGVLRNRTSSNQMQIELESTLSVKGGFSGCPVFLEDTDAVVGMIVTADEGNRLAFMVPSDLLAKQLKYEEPRRGTNLWKVHYFRRNILTALLDDLYSFEGDGYDHTVCETVRVSLGSVANAISLVDDRAYWTRGLHDEVEDFVTIYKLWNGCPRGAVGAHERNAELRQLRKKRTAISTKIREAQGLLGAEQDHEMMDDIFDAIRGITRTYPAKFVALERGLMRLDNRTAG